MNFYSHGPLGFRAWGTSLVVFVVLAGDVHAACRPMKEAIEVFIASTLWVISLQLPCHRPEQDRAYIVYYLAAVLLLL